MNYKNPTTPPKTALRLLRSFCPEHLYEEIEGDLIYKFNKDVNSVGEKKAKRKLIWNAIRFFRPGILLRRQNTIRPNMMLLNNIKFSLRHLGRQKINTFIHVSGLTVGISVCLVIALFIHHELSFDSYHPDVTNTYRVNTVFKESEKQFDLYASPIPLAQKLRTEIPGLKYVALALPQFSSIIQKTPETKFKQDHILIVEPQYVDIFKIDMLAGDERSALSKPYQAIISETVSHKLFGNDYPIGKTFKYRNEFEITVAGLMSDLPSGTSLPTSILLSYTDNEKFLNNGDTWYFGNFSWTKIQASTFVVQNESSNTLNLQEQLDKIANNNINSSPELDKSLKGNFELQPLSEIHLDDTRFGGGPWVKAMSSSWLWIFGSIGIIVLVLACINFLNLSVAQAITRTKEVSVRKVIGAKRTQLIGQFLLEACLITIGAGILSLIIVHLTLPSINLLTEKNLNTRLLQNPEVLLLFFAFLLSLGAIAGLYPSIVMARFKPSALLKPGKSSSTTSWLQQSLVVAQFSISATLAIAVLLIARQVNYMHFKDIGLEKENILQVPITNAKEGDAFVNQVRQISGVKEVSLLRSAPISNDHWWNTISNEETSERYSVCAIHGDEHFYSVYGLNLLSGRIPDSANKDTLISRVVVNVKLLKTLNLGSPQEAVGKQFWWGGAAEISGVVADFNSEPLHYEVSPTLITSDPSVYAQANIRLEPIHPDNQLKAIESIWRKTFPDDVYEARFLDQQIDAFYKTESKFYSMFLVFAILAILISCMGLWGIASFVTLRRVKEVSIRKVLGATISGIVTMLLRQFLKPVLIACLIALPLAWKAISMILSNYAYQVNITWDLFALPFVALIGISILTVSVRTIKASLTNPADNLRSE